jgi:hypothetical protein
LHQLLRRRFPIIADGRQDASLPLLIGRHYLLTKTKDLQGLLRHFRFTRLFFTRFTATAGPFMREMFPINKVFVLFVPQWLAIEVSAEPIGVSYEFVATRLPVICVLAAAQSSPLACLERQAASKYPCPQVAIDRRTTWHESCGKVRLVVR